MLINLIRKYIGGVRFALTLFVVLLGSVVVLVDLFFKLALSMQAYSFLGAMLAAVAVFVWKDTARPSGAERAPESQIKTNAD